MYEEAIASGVSSVIEVRTDREQNVEVHKELRKQLWSAAVKTAAFTKRHSKCRTPK